MIFGVPGRPGILGPELGRKTNNTKMLTQQKSTGDKLNWRRRCKNFGPARLAIQLQLRTRILIELLFH